MSAEVVDFVARQIDVRERAGAKPASLCPGALPLVTRFLPTPLMGDRYLLGWELMRAFFQSVPSVDGPPATIEAPWRAYLAGYTSECQIEHRDVVNAYDSYLLQLTASTYGLRLPLDDGLRAFGRWRTHLAGHLAEHRSAFREMMASQARTSGKNHP